MFHLTMEYSRELLWNTMSHIDTTMSYDELECLVNFVAFEEMGIDITFINVINNIFHRQRWS